MANLQASIETARQSEAGVSDQELLNRYVAGRDEAAFARLVERYGGTIWGLCRRVLQKEHDAEDAYQAVFIVLARKASSIRSGEAVGGWLYRVAYRIAMKARKSLQRRHEAEKPTADIAHENPPWSEAALREMQRILDEEVDRLSEKYRAPFVLCCLEGMSKPEAARELHWPEETVKARLAQARKLLQSRLARRGITLSAVLTALALVQSTASAAAPVVAALSAGAGVSLSSSSVAMAESFVSGLALTKLKSALAVLLMLTMTVAGAGLTAYHLGSDEQAPEAPPEVTKAALVFNDPETFLAPPTPLMKPHDEQVLALALSPDGNRLVTAGARHTLPGQFIVWDVETQRLVVRKRDLRGIRGVAFSPDGKTVACGLFGGNVDLRDAETGNDLGVLTGHKVGVNAVAYSANGDQLASAGLDSLVKLWDVKKLAETKSFAGHIGMVFTVAYFRHGKAIVSGGQDQTAKIWDIDSGKVKLNLTSHKGAVEAVAVSPNDKIVATASWDQTIKLWNAETGKEEAELQTSEGLVLAVAFSHDGTLLASSSVDGSMRIWDVKTRTTIKRLEKHASQVWSIAFTPNGKILATGSSDATAKLWDLEAGKEIATLTTAELKPVQAVAYTPDGKSLAIAGNDKYVQVRDAKSGDVRFTLAGHTDVVNCVAVSPDGATLASGSSDKTIKLWDLATGQEKRTLNGHTGAVLALAFARDGKLASGGEDTLVQWWDLADGKEPMPLKGHESAVLAIAFAPDGLTLASAGGNRAMPAFVPGSGGLAKGGGDRAIRMWTFGKDIPSRILTGHTGSVRALAFAPDGRLASGGDDAVVKVWEPGAGRERHTLGGHATSILSLAFTPGGRTLVSGGANRNAFVWDPVSGKRRGTLSGHKGAVTALAMHPQGDHLITGSADSTLLRWRGSASTTPARILTGNPEGVWFAQYSPTNDRLATGGANGAVTLWARSLVPAQLPYSSLTGVFWDADFAPDGRTIAVARDTNVQILDATTGQVQRTIPMGKPVRSVKFSADKRYLAATTGSSKAPDGPYEAKLFDAVTWKALATLDGHKGNVLRTAFSPDGKTLATSAADRTTKLWDLPSGTLRATLETKSAAAKGLLFLSDGTLVTSCWDKSIRFWDVESKSEKKKWDLGVNMTTLAVSADGSLLAAAEHPSPGEGPAELKVWDVATGKVVHNPKGHSARILGLAFTPDGRGLIASGGKLNNFGEIHYWDLASGQMRGAHTTPNQWLENVLVSPDGRRVVSAASNALRLWDLEFLHVERTWTAHSSTASSGVFANGGATLVTAGWDKSIKIWDVRDSRLIATLDGHTKPIHALALLPDGKTIASAGDDATVKLWDLESAKEKASLDAHARSVYTLAVSPDGKTLASGGGEPRSPGLSELILWDLETLKPRKTSKDPERAVLGLAYSPDGKSLAASFAEGGYVRVSSTANDALLARFIVRKLGPVTFSPDSKLIAVGTGNAPTDPGSVRVWETATWKERSALEKHTNVVSSVAFSPDGQTIASASQDGTIKLHPIPLGIAPVDGVIESGNAKTVPRVDAKEVVNAEIHVPLKGRPDNLPKMKLEGAHAQEWMRFDPTGLRITIPPGFQGLEGHVGFYTGVVLKGDFEATVNYEILKLPDSADAGPETGVTFSTWRLKSNMVITGATRRVVENGVPQFAGWATWFERAGKPSDHKGKVIATEAKTGRLRLLRRGGELSFYASDAPDAELTLLNQLSVGEQDMDNLRIIGFTGNPRASLDARFWDLHIRIGAIPRGPAETPNAEADEATPTKSGSKGWLAAVAVVGCLFALLAGLALFLRLRRSTAEEPPSATASRKPESAASPVTFSCSCGKPLKAKPGLAGKKLKCPGCGAPVLVPGKRSG